MTALKLDAAKPIRPGEELDTIRLQAHLLANLPGANGELSVEQFPSGWSNLTYLLKLGNQELVLRRPPFGNQVKSAHDMGREYRVLSKLCEVFPPAPRPYLYCEDPDVIGDQFYVMERRTGVVIRAVPPEALRSDPGLVRGLNEALIGCMAELHAVDYQAAGLGDLGHPQGYVERQVTGWIKRYRKSKTEDVPSMDQLGQWLTENMPPDGKSSLIHNDFKHDNLILDQADLTRVVAVLDWEMATIGDPLMDLGTTLAYWVQSNDELASSQPAFGPTCLAGSPTRQQVAALYAAKTGVDTSNILFYYCFGLYKLAVIVQQIYARFARGATNDPRFTELNRRVRALGDAGIKAIDSGSI